jgi:hypothetical protein
MTVSAMPLGDTVPSIALIRAAFDRMAALSRAFPCHVLVRPACVRAGAVLESLVPMGRETLAAVREHYRGGGLVRLHGRRPADLDTAQDGVSPMTCFPNHPFIAMLGNRPKSLADVIAVAFDGDELPLPDVVASSLRNLIGRGFAIRVHARDNAGLRRCCLAIALATGLLPHAGRA